MSKVISILGMLAYSLVSYGGAFVHANDNNGTNAITHPTGYDGIGDVVIVNVCISPASEDIELIESPLKNIIATMNRLQSKPRNVILGSGNNVPNDQVDWESVMLHEMGHCIGLAHPNLGSQFGLPPGGANATATTDGVS